MTDLLLNNSTYSIFSLLTNEGINITSTMKAFFSASLSIVLTATTNFFLHTAFETTPNAPLPTVYKTQCKYRTCITKEIPV